MSRIFSSIINFLTSPSRAKSLLEDNLFLEDQITELIEQYEDEKKKLTRKIIELKDKSHITPADFIPVIFKGDIKWYDYNSLADPKDREAYVQEATNVKNNPTFKNEINFLLNNEVKKSLQLPTTKENVQFLRDLQVSIDTLKAVQARFEEISQDVPLDPDDEITDEERFDTI